MDKVQEGRKKLMEDTAKTSEALVKKQEQLLKLRNENTLKHEKLLWLQGKEKKLERLHKDLHNQKGILVRKLGQEEGQNQNQAAAQNKLQELLNSNRYDKKFLELINQYLDKENRRYTRLGANKKQGAEDFINPYQVINVKPHLNGISETAVVRLDETTTFQQIKEISFFYWLLEQRYQKPDDQADPQGSFELTDEYFANIPLEEIVFKFYQKRGQTNLNQITLILRQKMLKLNHINYSQMESIKILGVKSYDGYKLDIFEVTKAQAKRINEYETFFSYYPGLRVSYLLSSDQFYIDEKLVLTEEENKIQEDAEKVKAPQPDQPGHENDEEEEDLIELYEFNDSHCCVMTNILIIFVLTLFTFSQFTDTVLGFHKNSSVTRQMLLQSGEQFQNIENFVDFWEYFTGTLGKVLLNSETEQSAFRDTNEIIGSIRIRQLKIQLEPCKKFIEEHQKDICFSDIYSDKNKFVEDLGNTEVLQDEWRKFRTSEQLGTVFLPSGKLNNYPGDGYVKDISRDTSYEVLLSQADQLVTEHFLDIHTQALFIQFTSYGPAHNIWIYSFLLLEKDLNDRFIPQQPIQLLFRPNIYEGSSGAIFIVLDIIKISSAVALFIFVGYTIKSRKWDWNYILLQVGSLNLALSILTIASSILPIFQAARRLHSQSLINTDEYIVLQKIIQLTKQDLYDEANYYNLAFIFQALVLLFACLRLSVLFKLDPRLKLVFMTLNRAMKEVLIFILLLAPYQLGFALAFQLLLGQKFPEFVRTISAISSTIFMFQGNYNIELLASTQGSLILIFMLMFYFFTIFFIIAIFQSFLIESIRCVIMTEGYSQPKSGGFNFNRFKHWFFSWIYIWFVKAPEKQKDPANPTEGSDALLDQNSDNFIQEASDP